MKEKIRTYKNLMLQKYNIFKEKGTLKKLASHKHTTIRAIGEALLESLVHRSSNKEQKWIDLIEQRRLTLLNSKNNITVIDYGAGKQNQKRTKEEMKKGVSYTTEVEEVCKASKPPFWAFILFKLIRKLEPTSCVELGSCVGISAGYMAGSA